MRFPLWRPRALSSRAASLVCARHFSFCNFINISVHLSFTTAENIVIVLLLLGNLSVFLRLKVVLLLYLLLFLSADHQILPRKLIKFDTTFQRAWCRHLSAPSPSQNLSPNALTYSAALPSPALLSAVCLLCSP